MQFHSQKYKFSRCFSLLFAAFLLSLTSLSADFSESPSSAVTENLPAAIVAGSVNAITGDHYIVQNDIVVEGAVPLRIPRAYISGVQSTLFKGWQLFHHVYASSDKGEDGYYRALSLTIIEPSGTYLHFQKQRKGKKDKKDKTIFLALSDNAQNKGLTNAGRGSLSGKTNLKNYHIRMTEDKESFSVYCPDGTLRQYRSMKGSKKEYSSSKDLWAHELFDGRAEKQLYMLKRETLPNKTGISYEYDEHHRLTKISATNHEGSKTYASASFHYHSENFHKNRDFDIHTSDGKVLHYRYQRKDNSFLLTSASTPTCPDEAMTYHHSKTPKDIYQLKYRTIGHDRHYKLEYYAAGHNDVGGEKATLKTDDPRISRVKTLSAPVGEDATPYITHRFFYFPEKHFTQVREIDNTLTEYYYSRNLQLEKIKHYGPGDEPHNTEQFVWGINQTYKSHLLCHTKFDHRDVPISSRRYFYDDLGNVKEEKLYGKISGKDCPPLTLDAEGLPINNGTETCSIHRQFTQDGLNLLLREKEPSGKVTTYTYLPDTALIASKFICEGEEIKIRTFYQYDKDYILIEETVDDGSSPNKEDLCGVKTRKSRKITPIPDGQPYQGMPWIIQNTYWDGTQDILLQKTILSYENGKITKQDIYDSEDRNRYSLTMTYDQAGRLKEATNALGQVAKYKHDSLGNLILSEDPSGNRLTKMHYDFSNRPTRIEEIGIDGHQRTTQYLYDKKHRKTAIINSFDLTTTSTFDAFGNETQRHTPTIYDPDGHPLAAVTTHSYDSFGRRLSTTEPNSDCTRFTYNSQNQILTIEHPDEKAEQFIYNDDGTLHRHINQLEAATTYRYDFLGRLTAKTNPLGDTTAYQYDAFNLISETNAEGQTTNYTYDGAGRKNAESLGQQKVEFSYDPLGRLSCTYSDELCTLQNYDDLDRVIEERQENRSGTLLSKIRYTYDLAGNRESVIRYIHNQESQETFAYDSFNRLTSCTDPIMVPEIRTTC